MKRIIFTYIVAIQKARRKILGFYNIQEDLSWIQLRTQVPVSSSVDKNLSYKFHGGGCGLIINETICEFDYAPVNKFPVKFEIWKIKEYIRTSQEFEDIKTSEEEILSSINLLIEEGVLTKLIIGDFELDTYQIQKKYYDNPNLLLDENK